MPDVAELARKAAKSAITDLIDDGPGLYEVLEFVEPEIEQLSDPDADQLVERVREELTRLRDVYDVPTA